VRIEAGKVGGKEGVLEGGRIAVLEQRIAEPRAASLPALHRLFPQEFGGAEEAPITVEVSADEIGNREVERHIARAIVLPPRQPGLYRAVGMKQMQVQCQVGARGAQGFRAVPIFRDEKQREVADRVIDACAMFDKRAFRVNVEALREIGFYRRPDG
jgi:hypothetical protein